MVTQEAQGAAANNRFVAAANNLLPQQGLQQVVQQSPEIKDTFDIMRDIARLMDALDPLERVAAVRWIMTREGISQ